MKINNIEKLYIVKNGTNFFSFVQRSFRVFFMNSVNYIVCVPSLNHCDKKAVRKLDIIKVLMMLRLLLRFK